MTVSFFISSLPNPRSQKAHPDFPSADVQNPPEAWLCENISLDHIAACLSEEFNGVHILHALCNGLYIQLPGHIDNIGHDNSFAPDIPALVEE